MLTYRTFISTLALLWKLQYRFRRFNDHDDPTHLRAARNAFSLMVSLSIKLLLNSLIDVRFFKTTVLTVFHVGVT